MRIVVDTNCIISAMLRDGTSRKIITHCKSELMAIDFSRTEIEAHKSELLKKAKISEESFAMLMDGLFSRFSVIDHSIVKSRLTEADKIMGTIDHSDSPFVAAALAVGAVIWSDDAHFKKQRKIRVFTTKELLREVRL